jgi:branched-subunit amino acid aminotransferase/4-amino-4-deoxychorismate lyase
VSDIVFLDTGFMPSDRARLPALSHAVLYGEGLFETLRTYGGRPFAFEQHLERLRGSAGALAIPLPARLERLPAIIGSLLERNGLRDAVIRISLLAGPAGPKAGGLFSPAARSHLLVSARKIPRELAAERARGIAVTTHPCGAPFLAAHKATSYLRSIEARRTGAGAREVLLVDDAGRILEGAASNVFAILGGSLVTPPARGRILAGIARRIVMETARAAGYPVRERNLDRKVIGRAEGIFITSSVVEILPVARIDGREVGPPHRLCRELHALYRERVRRDQG